MAPKTSPEKLRREFEREKLRERVLELHNVDKLSLGAISAHPYVMVSRVTVQSSIKVFKGRQSVKTLPKSGRKSKLTPRYELEPFATYFRVFLCVFSKFKLL